MPATALPPATVTGPERAGRVAEVLRANPIGNGKATVPSVPSRTQAASLSAKTLPPVERALVQRWRHARTSRGAQRSAGEETPREHAQGMRMPIVCKRRLACRHGRYTVVVPSPRIQRAFSFVYGLLFRLRFPMSGCSPASEEKRRRLVAKSSSGSGSRADDGCAGYRGTVRVPGYVSQYLE